MLKFAQKTGGSTSSLHHHVEGGVRMHPNVWNNHMLVRGVMLERQQFLVALFGRAALLSKRHMRGPLEHILSDVRRLKSDTGK